MADKSGLVGFEAASRRLRLMPLQAAGVIADAVEKGGEPVRDAASDLAPERTGKLKGEIIVEKAKTIGAHGAKTKIGPSNKAWYGLFPELGTGRGWEGNAHPFLRPAADLHWRAAAQIVAREIRDSIL